MYSKYVFGSKLLKVMEQVSYWIKFTTVIIKLSLNSVKWKKNITLALSCFVALREQPRQSEMSEYVTLQKKKITKTKSVFLKCFSLLCSQWCFVVSLTSKSRQSGWTDAGESAGPPAAGLDTISLGDTLRFSSVCNLFCLSRWWMSCLLALLFVL